MTVLALCPSLTLQLWKNITSCQMIGSIISISACYMHIFRYAQDISAYFGCDNYLGFLHAYSSELVNLCHYLHFGLRIRL